MTSQQKKDKIMASIASRGWWLLGTYENEAAELYNEGKIKRGSRYFTGGNEKMVWVAS